MIARRTQWLAGFGLCSAIALSPLHATAPQGTAAPYEQVSAHTAVIDGQRVAYRAVVEESFVRDAHGRPTASIVSTSYLRSGLGHASERPVLFVFNGGPGSASLWLHLGLVGPRRVDLDGSRGDGVHPPTTPPFNLVDNHDSLLDVTDIVLYDPPGTGYSRVFPSGKDASFFGVQQDAAATADFIRDWCRRHDRMNSPKFVLGESYGTVRAAVTARLLAAGPTANGRMDAITLNGVILLGQDLDMRSTDPDLEAVQLLPSLAATAWYHQAGKGGTNESLAERVDDAKHFAGTDYIQALYAGSALDSALRDKLASRLAALLGVSKDFVIASHLRITATAFANELLQNAGQQVGLYDSRFTLPLVADGGDPVADDPAMGQYVPGFVVAADTYFHHELGVSLDRTYNAIEFRQINAKWDYGLGPGIPSQHDYATDLAVAMRRNPAFQLFVGAGYYDLVTPLGKADYTLAHTGIDPMRIEQKYYAAGHMTYLGAANRHTTARDLRDFIRRAAAVNTDPTPANTRSDRGNAP